MQRKLKSSSTVGTNVSSAFKSHGHRSTHLVPGSRPVSFLGLHPPSFILPQTPNSSLGPTFCAPAQFKQPCLSKLQPSGPCQDIYYPPTCTHPTSQRSLAWDILLQSLPRSISLIFSFIHLAQTPSLAQTSQTVPQHHLDSPACVAQSLQVPYLPHPSFQPSKVVHLVSCSPVS